MNVRKANIIYTQFKVLPVLHHGHGELLHVELESERALELLLIG